MKLIFSELMVNITTSLNSTSSTFSCRPNAISLAFLCTLGQFVYLYLNNCSSTEVASVDMGRCPDKRPFAKGCCQLTFLMRYFVRLKKESEQYFNGVKIFTSFQFKSSLPNFLRSCWYQLLVRKTED